jgi:pimeloyl-ACP methyl ester carboxylesterase
MPGNEENGRPGAAARDAVKGGGANSAKTQRINVDDMSLAYRSIGARAEVPIVLLQRFRGTMDDWDPVFLDALADGRQVILFDSAGVGLSGGETPPGIPGMAAVASALIDGLGYPQVDILGWSMGGSVALTLTLQRPDLVRCLIVAGSGPGGVPNAPASPSKVWEVAPRPVNTSEDFLYLFFPETAEGRSQGLRYLARQNLRSEAPVPPVKPKSVAAQIAALTAFRGADSVYARLPDIQQPTLVANGIHDVMVPAFNSYAAAERLPLGQLILYPASGHAFLFQLCEQFVADVNAFLDRR